MKLSTNKEITYDLTLLSLVGKEITISKAKNKNLEGLKGTLLQESANSLCLKTKNGIKQLLKGSICEIQLNHKGKALNMDVGLLYSTIINRIKKFK